MNRVSRLAAMLLGCWMSVEASAGEIVSLRQHSKTLIEAENFSANSPEYPYTEPCKHCSGGQNLGYFWKDSWFEVQVQVVQESTFLLTLRTASPDGTSIELLRTDSTDGKPKPVELIEVPQTHEWMRYATTDATLIQLPAGIQTLRFRNLAGGANVDFMTFAPAGTRESPTTYEPPLTAGPDRNPLKGFNSGWWRADEDFATVGFQYIEWKDFEPQDDQFDWEHVEGVINREGSRGRHLILQFVVDWDYREPIDENYVGPTWLLPQVGEHRGHADPNDRSSRRMRATKYNDPKYIEEATEAIEALTEYFQDDPRVFVLQAGLLGFWSEWHTFPREDWSPNNKTKQAIINAYLGNLPPAAFTQIRYPDEAAIEPQDRIGYSNGSATPTEHGYEFGRTIQEMKLWQNGPITGEWPPNVEHEYWERFFLTDEGAQFVKQARYSTLLMPEFKDIEKELPGWRSEDRFMSLHRELGYNFQIERVQHQVIENGTVRIEARLKNTGIAPFYQDWDLQFAVIDSANSSLVETIQVATDLREFGPSISKVIRGQGKTTLRSNRQYQIGLRISQPGADQPKTSPWLLDARNVYVVLANEIQVIDGSWNEQNHALDGGWNLLGPIQIPPSNLLFDGDSFPFSGSVRPARPSAQGSNE